MQFDYDSLKRLSNLTGLEHLLLSYFTGSLQLLSIDNNEKDSFRVARLRILARSVCDELNIKSFL